MTSKVYFTNLTANKSEDNKINKLQKLYDKLEFNNNIKENDKVAIKMHFGELGNTAYLHPTYARQIVDNIKQANGKPFLTDTNTLYHYKRHNAVDHLETAVRHGYTDAVLNAPVIIADGLNGQNDKDVEVNGKNFKNVKIASDILESDAIVVVSHVKGHILAGFGGALKNLSMGCASRAGKTDQHKLMQPTISKDKCTSCNACVQGCPEDAISLDSTAKINYDICIGCNDCLEFCPVAAIELSIPNATKFIEGMMEYSYGAVKDKKENKVIYINFLTDISPECDCCGWSDRPIVPDIGILASYDPVAIDKASYDLINEQVGYKNSVLHENYEKGQDKFKGVWENVDGTIQMKTAEKLGMGISEYELIEIN